MKHNEPVEHGTEQEESPRQMFTVSYETLVKAFIGGLIALTVWSYNEITSLRKEKVDKIEFFHEVTVMKDSLNRIESGMTRHLEQTAQNAQSVRDAVSRAEGRAKGQ